MAEARTEEDEETVREPREPVVRRQPRTSSSGDRPDRRKPEHRHSQGPLSSIRAAIKRTSNRSTSLSEAPARDRERDRRRPEITILSAEPLSSTSWFPGASGGFPPPPPPAAQIWGPTIPPSIQPPPSYEEVIREKSQEQVLFPPPSSSSASRRSVSTTTIATQTDQGLSPNPKAPPARRPVKPPRPSLPYSPKLSHIDDITTSAGQSLLVSPHNSSQPSSTHNEARADTHSDPGTITHSNTHSTTSTTTHSNTHSTTSTTTHSNTHTRSVTRSRSCDFLCDPFSLLTSTSDAQIYQWEPFSNPVTVVTGFSPSPDIPLSRPRPRPRSKPNLQPVGHEVKVQTLVKLREDGLATLAARKGSDITDQLNQGKYLQELLEAFSSDDWGFPDHRSDGSWNSQSDGEEEEEEENKVENQEEELVEEEMGTLKARIQAFEQQQMNDSNYGDSNGRDDVNAEEAAAKRPEPRPRPRLQGQHPHKLAPPTVAPKPKTLPHPKPSCKVFWEDGGLMTTAMDSGNVDAPKTSDTSSVSLPTAQASLEAATSHAMNAVPETQLPSTSEKPSVVHPKHQPPRFTEASVSDVKPQLTIEPFVPTASSTTPNLAPSPSPAPVPAPRPPPPKTNPSHSSNGVKGETTAPANTRPPPRPPVAPRASAGAPSLEKSSVVGSAAPALPPRPSVVVSSVGSTSDGAEIEAEVATANTHPVLVKTGSRPSLPTKPPTIASSRRASAPSLVAKPSGPSPTPQDSASNPAPPKPPTPAPVKPTSTSAPGPGSKAPPPAPIPAIPPPTDPKPPAPAQRRRDLSQGKADPVDSTASPGSSEPSLPPRPSGVKLLPLRPPPIKNVPGRPPPPAINPTSSSSTNQLAPLKTSPSPSPSPANQPPASKTSPSVSPANQTQGQKAPKRGPPLPPRPKSGHPLFNSVVKQEVLVVLDDPSPAPTESLLDQGWDQTVITPNLDQSKCLLDLDVQPEPILNLDSQSKPVSEGLSESQSILLVQPTELKQEPCPVLSSGPRCVAKFDYESEEEDELTFSQGDVIALKEMIGEEWGRGQLHGRMGIFPLNFVEIVEPLPSASLLPGETKVDPATAENLEDPPDGSNASRGQDTQAEEWAVALFDFPGQTAEDLSFHKGALIRVIQHVDAEWRRGSVEGREGVYPAAFTQSRAQPIPGQQAVVRGVAKAVFEFKGENEDELTLKVGDIISDVECVDEEWIMGVLEGKRGIVPKNFVSLM